jgi:membrane protein
VPAGDEPTDDTPAAERADEPVARRSRFALVRGTFSRLDGASVTDLGAFLAYYSALSIFPMIAALVALLGLIGGEGTAQTLIDAVSSIAPQSAVDALRGPIHGLVSSNGQASVAALIAFVAALWAASGYVGGFVRAANAIHGVDESRPLVKLRAVQLGLTLVSLAFLALMLVAIGLSGPVLHSAAGSLGFGSTDETIFEVIRWPLLALAGASVIAVLARYGPDLDPRPWSAVVTGMALSLFIWILASAAFALFVATLGSYQATYATLAGAIVFLIWLWISNVALLAGVALNAELAAREAEHPTLEAETAPQPRHHGVERTA